MSGGCIYLVLFLQFNGFLGVLLLLHPKLLVAVLQQVKERGGRPAGRKRERLEVLEGQPRSLHQGCPPDIQAAHWEMVTKTLPKSRL